MKNIKEKKRVPHSNNILNEKQNPLTEKHTQQSAIMKEKSSEKINEIKSILTANSYSQSEIDSFLKENAVEIEGFLESNNGDAHNFVNNILVNKINKKSTDNDSEKMAKKKNVEGKAKGITIATQMVKSKAKYENFTKVSKKLTVGDKTITGEEAQALFYSRKYSRLGTVIADGTEEQHNAAIEILKSYQKLSGPEQTKQAEKTLDSLLSTYSKGGKGGGGRSKLSDEDKVDFSSLF